LGALDDEAHVERTRAVVETERAWLSARFDELDLEHVPSVTNFLFTNIGTRAAEVNEALLSRGVVIRPMSAPGIESWARISVGDRAGNERLVAALADALA
jgi:histidinol-phosphate aminotransferase